mgnify:FL=1
MNKSFLIFYKQTSFRIKFIDIFESKYYIVYRGNIMKRLYIDFDGVVMDTIPPLYEALQKSGADVTNESEIRVFFASYDFSKIINDDNILNDSINCIKKLIDSKMFEISFLTHVNSLTEGCVKVEYLRRHFKDITIIMVPKEISKTKVVHSEGAILVDDYSGNLKEWEENGGIAVRFSKELESHGYKVLNHLDELIDMFKDEEVGVC